MNDELIDRATGVLYGAVAGTELGLRHGGLNPRGLAAADLQQRLAVPLAWRRLPSRHPHRTSSIALTPLLHSVVRAFSKREGRVTPEGWAAELKEDGTLTNARAFWLLDLYSALELLREGMSPRLTGQGTTPSGTACLAAIPVGLYHAGDPDAAFVDGMEIASVMQRLPATEWAALTAAAVSAAVTPGASAQEVVTATMEVARRRAPQTGDALKQRLQEGRSWPAGEFALNYLTGVASREWWATDPLGWALVLLERYQGDLSAALNLAARAVDAHVHGGVAGALAGALAATAELPVEWQAAAEPLVAPQLDLLPIIERKLAHEKVVVQELSAALQPAADGAPRLFDRVYGCILAGAIGNAMGSPAEGMLYTEVDAKWPGGITTILQPERLENEDDNQMAMLLTKTYLRLAGRQVTARDFGATWMSSMKREGFWLCCRNVYDLLKGGLDPRISGHWNWVTGSTVMCMEPVGLYHLADPGNAYIDATMISYMEQRGLDVTAAAILAASVAEAVSPSASVGSVLEAALAAAPRERMHTFDQRDPNNPYDYLCLCLNIADKYNDVLAAREELYEKCLYYHHIDPLELLGLAYAMFKIAQGDVRQAAIGGASIGRDADTICGRAAMLAGTLSGASAVPAEWVEMVPAAVLQGMQTAARGIVDLLQNGKLPAMTKRQELLG